MRRESGLLSTCQSERLEGGAYCACWTESSCSSVCCTAVDCRWVRSIMSCAMCYCGFQTIFRHFRVLFLRPVDVMCYYIKIYSRTIEWLLRCIVNVCPSFSFQQFWQQGQAVVSHLHSPFTCLSWHVAHWNAILKFLVQSSLWLTIWCVLTSRLTFILGQAGLVDCSSSPPASLSTLPPLVSFCCYLSRAHVFLIQRGLDIA